MGSKLINEVIGANVKRLRKEREYTQEELAGKANLHVTFIAHIESGKKICSVKSLNRLAKALGVHPEILLLSAGSKPKIREYSEKVNKLISLVRDLPDSKKELVVQIARVVAGK